MKKNKIGQIWGMDLMIAAAIFSIALAFFYIYTFNQSAESEIIIESLSYEGGIITDTLLSEGAPTNWNETNVIQLGILSQGKINETKLELFYTLAQNDYFKLKRTLNTQYDFYFFLEENMTINTQTIDGIGYTGITRNNINEETIITIERITIYQNKPMKATLYLWP